MVVWYLASLFTAILRHGYMPKLLRDCILVPIPKGSKDPTLSENYRAIALAHTLSKALEWCILLAYPQLFVTSGLQFGLRKMSTSLCTGTIKDIVSRCMFRGSSVFACFLDASKAFDLINHGVLLRDFLIGTCRSDGVTISLPLSPCLMVCDKEASSPLFCSQSILMTC